MQRPLRKVSEHETTNLKHVYERLDCNKTLTRAIKETSVVNIKDGLLNEPNSCSTPGHSRALKGRNSTFSLPFGVCQMMSFLRFHCFSGSQNDVSNPTHETQVPKYLRYMCRWPQSWLERWTAAIRNRNPSHSPLWLAQRVRALRSRRSRSSADGSGGLPTYVYTSRSHLTPILHEP